MRDQLMGETSMSKLHWAKWGMKKEWLRRLKAPYGRTRMWLDALADLTLRQAQCGRMTGRLT